MRLIQVVLLRSLLGSAVALSTAPGLMAAEHEPILGRFHTTYYYLAREADYPHERLDTVIRDLKGGVLARVSTAFKRALTGEGSGKLRDGRVVNWAGKKNGEVRFRLTPNPYGDGFGACALVPFRTVAVDPAKIPLGALVRIDETIGMLLPDGTFHDGLWKAEDIGEAIKGERIDLFVGERDHGAVLERHQIIHLRPLTIRLVSPPADDTCVKKPPPGQ